VQAGRQGGGFREELNASGLSLSNSSAAHPANVPQTPTGLSPSPL
jgi:hypothetical protein